MQDVAPGIFNLVRPVWRQASKSLKKSFVEMLRIFLRAHILQDSSTVRIWGV